MSDMTPGLERLLADAAGPALSTETADEARVLAAFVHARNNRELAPAPARRHAPRFVLKLGTVTAAVVLGSTAVAAAANVLPRPVQSVAYNALGFPSPKPQPGVTLQTQTQPTVDPASRALLPYLAQCRTLVAADAGTQAALTAEPQYDPIKIQIDDTDAAAVVAACQKLVAEVPLPSGTPSHGAGVPAQPSAPGSHGAASPAAQPSLAGEPSEAGEPSSGHATPTATSGHDDASATARPSTGDDRSNPFGPGSGSSGGSGQGSGGSGGTGTGSGSGGSSGGSGGHHQSSDDSGSSWSSDNWSSKQGSDSQSSSGSGKSQSTSGQSSGGSGQSSSSDQASSSGQASSSSSQTSNADGNQSGKGQTAGTGH